MGKYKNKEEMILFFFFLRFQTSFLIITCTPLSHCIARDSEIFLYIFMRYYYSLLLFEQTIHMSHTHTQTSEILTLRYIPQ